MNIQALMKQAQNMQKEIQKAQEEVGKMEFTSKKELVEVTVNGNKEVLSVKIDENVEKDDIEVLQDMILYPFFEILLELFLQNQHKLQFVL